MDNYKHPFAFCNNEKCDKTHCARHRSRHNGACAQDLNEQNKFTCPQYYPLFKARNERRDL